MFDELKIGQTVYISYSKPDPYNTTGMWYVVPKKAVVMYIFNDPKAKNPYLVQLENLTYQCINTSHLSKGV